MARATDRRPLSRFAGVLVPSGSPLLEASASRAHARREITDAVIDAAAERHRRTLLELVDEHDDILLRTGRPGHLTGSALVIDRRGHHVVLLHHRKLGLWLQPGGHCDGDANLAAVALREAEEETGLEGLQIVTPAIDIDVHRVEPPGESAHLHLDVRYLVVAPVEGHDGDPPGNHESTAIRWVRPDDLDRFGVDPGTGRMVTQGLRRWAELGRPS